MDLDFSEEQLLLRDTVRDLCAKHVPLDTVRALENDPERYAEDFWKQAAQLGLHGMRLPEEHGGTDMTLLDAALVYSEFGRRWCPRRTSPARCWPGRSSPLRVARSSGNGGSRASPRGPGCSL